MSIVFAPEALEDLRSAIEYIAARNPQAAARLAERVLDVIERLAERDFEGPEQKLHSGEVVRSWPVAPFRVYYQRGSDALHVLRLYHQAREPL